jgi:AbrB family looped-hinge helix DNA binding protein
LEEVKVLQGYLVTIPKEARERLKIEKGDTLRLEIEGARMILTSNKIPRNPTLKMLGLAAGHDEPLEEALIGEVEEKLAREKVR